MSDELSNDLASLKIDRDAPRRGGGLPWKPLLWLGVLAALAYGGWAMGVPYFEQKVFKAEVDLTEIRVISPAQATTELTSTGYVEPQLVTKVAPKIPGRVSAVHVKEGQQVAQGDLLLELEMADREAQIAAARAKSSAVRAGIATAQANLAETRQQAERQRRLVERGVSPAATAEDLEARVASLSQAAKAVQAEARAAKAQVSALMVDLQYMKVRAPIAGTIINRPPEVGELVGVDLGFGDKTIEIADFSTLLVETDIPEGRLYLAKVGSPCEIVLDAFPKRRFRGEAVEISPRVDRAKATVKVKVKFVDPTDGVLPDMSARVSFLAEALDMAAMKEEPKTVVPANAVTERAGAKVVFVVDSGKVRLRTVELGEKMGSGYELLSGPPPGAQLVADPPDELADGKKIKERE